MKRYHRLRTCRGNRPAPQVMTGMLLNFAKASRAAQAGTTDESPPPPPAPFPHQPPSAPGCQFSPGPRRSMLRHQVGHSVAHADAGLQVMSKIQGHDGYTCALSSRTATPLTGHTPTLIPVTLVAHRRRADGRRKKRNMLGRNYGREHPPPLPPPASVGAGVSVLSEASQIHVTTSGRTRRGTCRCGFAGLVQGSGS